MKKTNKELYTTLLTVIENSTLDTDLKLELTDFVNGKLDQLAKKAETVSKAQKEKDAANAAIGEQIIKCLAAMAKPMKVSDLIKQCSELNDYSTQKLTPILSKLYAAGEIEKETFKRETYYKVKS